MEGNFADVVFFVLIAWGFVLLVLFRQWQEHNLKPQENMDDRFPWGRYNDAIVQSPGFPIRDLTTYGD